MLSDKAKRIEEMIRATKVLPLYTSTNLDYLDTLERILLSNNVTLIEVTFRSNLAIEAIRHLAASGELIVGAGTVRTIKQAQAAIENGAQFIVCPAIVPSVIDYCLENGVAVFPGTATPTDIQQAISFGLKVVKFFPANIYGGIEAIQALSGPYYDVQFLPTGGIHQDNVKDYLNNKQVIAVGGSFIISEEKIAVDDGKTANEALRNLMSQING